jgi:hypothetical protein
MLALIVLLISLVALLALFVLQTERSRENAKETAKLRASGTTWDHWFRR